MFNVLYILVNYILGNIRGMMIFSGGSSPLSTKLIWSTHSLASRVLLAVNCEEHVTHR